MTRVAVAGLGAIGRVARVPGSRQGCRDGADRRRRARLARAEATLRELGADVPVKPIAELEPLADLVVECAPAHLLPAIAEPFLRAGKEVVVLSAGAMLEHPHLVDLGQASTAAGSRCRRARCSGSTRSAAAAEGEIRSLRLTTRKPPAGLVGAPGHRRERHRPRKA